MTGRLRLKSPALRWTVGLLAVLVLATAVAEVLGWPFLRQPLQSVLARSAGVPVRLEGHFNLHLLWRPRLAVGHLNLAPGAGVAVPHLVDARDVELAWRWRDIWHWHQGGVLRVQSLSAAVLDAHLVRGKDGRASWQLGTAAAAPAAPDPQAPLAGLPRFGMLRIDNGLILVDDQPLLTQLRIALRGGEGDALPDGTRAGYSASITGRWQALPLTLQVRTGSTLPLLQDAEAASAPGATSGAPSLAVRVEGQAGAARVLFDGSAEALMGDRRMQGKLRFSGPSLAQVGAPLGVTLPQTPPFELQGRLGHDAGVWTLRADRAAIGSSLLNGDFTFDTRRSPSRLSGRLGGTRLALADLGPSIGAAGGSGAAAGAAGAQAGAASAASAAVSKPPDAAAAPGRVLPQRRFDLPSMRAMDADVQIAIDELSFGSDAVSSLRGLQTHLLLQAGVLELQALKASVAGGQFSGSTRLDAGTEPARWAADLRFSTIDVAGWLPGVRSEAGRAQAPRASDGKGLKDQRNDARQGGDQPVNAYLTGTLNGHVQVTGRGRSTAEILSTLDGQADVMLRDGTVSHLVTELAGLDIAQALGVLIRRDHPLPLRCARLDVVLQQGVVRPRVAVLDNNDSTVRVEGQVDLRDETLALRATTRPKDFSPLTLRTPITVGGTLNAPAVGVDGKRLAGKALGALALGAVVAPIAALLPLLDPGSREPGDPCVDAPPAAAKPASSPAAAIVGGARKP